MTKTIEARRKTSIGTNRSRRLPDARLSFTLRDFNVSDWRPKVPEGKRIYMRSRVSVGMPDEMRYNVVLLKQQTGLSMSEIMRRCFVAEAVGQKARVR